MLLLINCCHEFVNVGLLFVDVDLIVVLIIDDVLLLHEFVFFEKFSLEAGKQSIIDSLEVLDMLAVICERNLLSNDREMRAGSNT